MKLINKLLRRNQMQSEGQAALFSPKDMFSHDMSEIEMAIAEKTVQMSDYPKIPLVEIATLGGVFAQLSPALRTVAQSVTVDGVGYMPINNLNGEALKAFSKSTPQIFAGAFKNQSTGKSTMAQFVKLSPQTIKTNAVMPINPAIMVMAAMLVHVNRKLDTIQRIQQQNLSFMQESKRAKLQGNLNMLTDILEHYKYNWENEQYRNNYHIKVLDIKQEAEHDMIFYQKQIADKIKELSAIATTQAMRESIAKVVDDFHNYSMALYSFSFSTYLEVMLLENFNKDYLDSVAQKVTNYQAYYHNQFIKCRDYTAKVSGNSIQIKIQEAVGQTEKALGNLISSSPILKKSPVDDWLKDSGNQLLRDKEKKIAQLVSAFESEQETGSELFIDSIRNVESICNDMQAIMFDKDYLYLVC